MRTSNILLVALNLVLFVFGIHRPISASSSRVLVGSPGAAAPNRRTTLTKPPTSRPTSKVPAEAVMATSAGESLKIHRSGLRLIAAATLFDSNRTTLSREIAEALGLTELEITDLSSGLRGVEEQLKSWEAAGAQLVTEPDGTPVLSVAAVDASEVRRILRRSIAGALHRPEIAALLMERVELEFEPYFAAKKLWIELPGAESQTPRSFFCAKFDSGRTGFQRWDLDEPFVNTRWRLLAEMAATSASRTGVRPGY